MTTKRILIAGIGGYWGERLSAALVGDPGWDVHGLDGLVPQPVPAGVTFRQYDIRGPQLAEVVAALAPDVVCQLGFLFEPAGSETYDHNVTGTMSLIEAAAAAGAGQVVLMSSTMAYGARATNPAFLAETAALHGNGAGYVQQWRAIEAFAAACRPVLGDTKLAVLRFAHIVGPTADSPFMRFLRDRMAPTLLGFDPMVQIIHEDDVVAALRQAVDTEADGVFNVGAPEPLPLARLLALTGRARLPLFHPLVYAAGRGPLPPDYLRYRCVADTGRMTDELGFYPSHDTADALRALRGRGEASDG